MTRLVFMGVVLSVLLIGAILALIRTRIPLAHTGPEVRCRQEDRRQAKLHLVLLTGGVLFIVPFVWTISISLKQIKELFQFPPLLLPESPQWVNYVEVWTRVPFGRWVVNTFVIAASALTNDTRPTLRSPMCMLPSRPRVGPSSRARYWARITLGFMPRTRNEPMSRWQGQRTSLASASNAGATPMASWPRPV